MLQQQCLLKSCVPIVFSCAACFRMSTAVVQLYYVLLSCFAARKHCRFAEEGETDEQNKYSSCQYAQTEFSIISVSASFDRASHLIKIISGSEDHNEIQRVCPLIMPNFFGSIFDSPPFVNKCQTFGDSKIMSTTLTLPYKWPPINYVKNVEATFIPSLSTAVKLSVTPNEILPKTPSPTS